jgi:hypothetical protein
MEQQALDNLQAGHMIYDMWNGMLFDFLRSLKIAVPPESERIDFFIKKATVLTGK